MRVGPAHGRSVLFAYTFDLAKTVDRRRLYEGTGCVAKGHLHQGLLADRHVLNALAACIAQPETLLHLFAPTQQEDIGRYCVKVFEAGGWRTVFVDDRLPCAHDCCPAFLSSSDPLEAFPMLLEKALAKYLGSYGHIALCSSWSDVVPMMLRLLTGGHVYRKGAVEFDWKSVEGQSKYSHMLKPFFGVIRVV
jgi:hypothetical protein